MRAPALAPLVACHALCTLVAFPRDARGADSGPPSNGSWRLAEPASLAVGLDGYAGILAQATAGRDRAHGFWGGMLRARLHYFQLGAFIDVTDSGESRGLGESEQEHFRTVGGFIGAWLPFQKFVDLDASLGLATRRYLNSSDIYGPSGLAQDTPALVLRLGISDRAFRSLLGARVGISLFGTADLNPRPATWHRTYLLPPDQGGGIGVTTGTTEVGGLAAGLLVSAGLEAGDPAP